MHLPYCFQAKQTFIEIYAQEIFKLDKMASDSKNQIINIAKRTDYLTFVNKTNLFKTLNQSHEINFDTYFKLHKKG